MAGSASSMALTSTFVQSIYHHRSTRVVESIREVIACIDDKIPTVHHQPQVQLLNELRVHFQTLLSPFHRVPTEILGYIFEYVVEQNSFGWESWHCKSSAYTLGQVCRRWRNITRSMPRLWSHIFIKVNPSASFPPPSFEQLADHILHSKTSLLSVELEVIVDSLRGHRDSSKDFLSLVLQQSHRWKAFSYVQPQDGDFRHTHFLEMILAQQFPSLRSLEVELDRSFDPDLPPQFDVCLLDLTLQNVHLSFDPDRMSLHCEQLPRIRFLTELRTEAYTRDAVLLLSSCPNLEVAQFTLLWDSENHEAFESKPSHVTKKALRRLVIESSGEEALCQLAFMLSSITGPSLTLLSIAVKLSIYESHTCNHEYAPEKCSLFDKELLQFLRRSNSSEVLKTFRLFDVPLGVVDTVNTLCMLSSLHALEIRFPELEVSPASIGYLFHQLKSWSTGDNYERTVYAHLYSHQVVALPLLREAKFTVDSDWQSNAFESWLQSRLGGKLHSVSLRIRGKMTYLDIDHLERLNAQTDMAVRVIEGEDKRDVLDYSVAHSEAKMAHQNLLQPTTSSLGSRLHRLRDPETIDSIRAIVTDIDKEIANTHNELDVQRLKHLRVEYQTLLSPFHRIPTSILAYIFELAVERNFFGWEPWHFKSDVYKLGQICRRWRKLTQSSPHLWVNISLKVNPNAYYPPITFRKLEDHLSRSRDSPLSVEVSIVLPYSPWTGNTSTNFLNVVLSQSYRWGSFKYTQPQNGRYGHTLFLEMALSRQMPALKSLEVELDATYSQEVPAQLALCMLGSPLRTVHLMFKATQMAAFPEYLACVGLLSNLHVEGVYTKDAATLISSCKNLVVAHFMLVADPDSQITFESMDALDITHKALRELTIECSNEKPLRQISLLFCSLTCPSLSSLAIATKLSSPKIEDNYDISPKSFTEELTQFFYRSKLQSELKLFRLVEGSLSTSNLIDIICAVPYLYRLELDVPNVHVACLLHIFHPRKDMTGRVSKIFHNKWLSLPKLREVKFTVENLLGARELEDMPRWPAPPAWLWRGKLKSVFLKVRGEETKGLDVSWFEWLNAETELAVRVVEGEEEREVVGYWVKPAVGLRRSCWRDLLSV